MGTNSNPRPLNSTRLSLVLDDLPLTPFGMETSKKRKAGAARKLGMQVEKKLESASRSPLSKNKKILPSSKENFPIPRSTMHINRRRRKLGPLHQNVFLSPIIDASLEDEQSEANDNNFDRVSKTNMQQINRNRRDSVFTDIDDGSFIEFVEKPLTANCLKQGSSSFYTCSINDNATQYSTSSKIDNAIVGFRKYVQKTVEYDERRKNVIKPKPIPFLLDETIVSSSKDLNKVCLNSTAYPIASKIALPNITNISSITLNCESDSSYNSCESSHSNPNVQIKKDSKPIECILIEDSDEDPSNVDEPIVELRNNCLPHHKPNSREKVSHGNVKSVASNNYPESSIISEDISIASSTQLCKSPLPVSKKFKKVILESSDSCEDIPVSPKYKTPLVHTKNKKINRDQEILSRLPQTLPVNDESATTERVSRWVATSPFKDSSFGTSFYTECKEDRVTRPRRNNIDSMSQELRLRLSSTTSEEDDSSISPEVTQGRPRNFIFDLCRVAESPDTNENQRVPSIPTSPVLNRSPVRNNAQINNMSQKSSQDSKIHGDYRVVNNDLKISSDDDTLQFIKQRDKVRSKNRVISSSSDESLACDKNEKKHSKLKPKAVKSFLTSDESETENNLENIRSRLDKIYHNGWRENEIDVLNSNKKTLNNIDNCKKDKINKEQSKKKSPIIKKKLDSFINDDSSDDDENSFFLPLLSRLTGECHKDEPVVNTKKVFNDKVSKGSSTPINGKISKTRVSSTDSSFSSFSDAESGDFPVSKTKKNVFKTPKNKIPKFVVKKGLTNSVTSSKKSNLSPKECSFLASLELGCPLERMHHDAIPFMKNFKKCKEELAEKLYIFFNENIFDKKLPEVMGMKWNARMTKTAGFCYYQMDSNKKSGKSARLELSSKVIDTPGRLRDTLIHELCHAASWIISGYKEGHGPLFKAWASLATARYPELPPIKTCHSYNISYKYTYKCSKCGYRIGRHSKSLDTERKICGHCRGTFEVFLTAKLDAATATPGKDSTPVLLPSTPRTPNPFALFVKANYGSVKKINGGIKHAEVMKELSAEFAKLKTKK